MRLFVIFLHLGGNWEENICLSRRKSQGHSQGSIGSIDPLKPNFLAHKNKTPIKNPGYISEKSLLVTLTAQLVTIKGAFFIAFRVQRQIPAAPKQVGPIVKEKLKFTARRSSSFSQGSWHLGFFSIKKLSPEIYAPVEDFT